MSQEKNKPEENNVIQEPQKSENTDSTRFAVKKKRFKKSDILVFALCLTVSLLIWMYASNLQKDAAEKEISKEVIADAVESGINKTTEAATDPSANN